MGSCASQETKEFKAIGQEIGSLKLRAELCSSWGYGSRSGSVKDLIKYLNKQGYHVVCDFVPKGSGRGEFYIFLEQNNTEYIVFSNNSAHEREGAKVSYMCRGEHYEDILNIIQNIVKNNN